MPKAIKALLAADLATDQPPADIQYMPPGTHRIHATRDGEPVSLDIHVDAKTADTLNSFLESRLTAAKDGSEDRPFFDFNHEDGRAAAWPTQFYWAGEDPRTGGVRAKVEWSGPGAKAIREKTYRRFSPTFIPDDEGRVIGSETNMGGLVNRAAFKTIQPLFAKEGDPDATDPDEDSVEANWSDAARAASLAVRRAKAAARQAAENSRFDYDSAVAFEKLDREQQIELLRSDPGAFEAFQNSQGIFSNDFINDLSSEVGSRPPPADEKGTPGSNEPPYSQTDPIQQLLDEWDNMSDAEKAEALRTDPTLQEDMANRDAQDDFRQRQQDAVEDRETDTGTGDADPGFQEQEREAQSLWDEIAADSQSQGPLTPNQVDQIDQLLGEWDSMSDADKAALMQSDPVLQEDMANQDAEAGFRSRQQDAIEDREQNPPPPPWDTDERNNPDLLDIMEQSRSDELEQNENEIRRRFEEAQEQKRSRTGNILHRLLFPLIDSRKSKPSNTTMPETTNAKPTDLKQQLQAAHNELAELRQRENKRVIAAAASRVRQAINAGQLPPKDSDQHQFWIRSILRDGSSAIKALEALPKNPVLESVTAKGDPKGRLQSKLQLQQQKLTEVAASMPTAKFETVFAKAQEAHPDLFR